MNEIENIGNLSE